MAFTDPHRSKHRAAVIVAVTAIEALAAVALIHGLTVTFRKADPLPPLIGEQIPLPKPSPMPSPDIKTHDPVIPTPQPTASPQIGPIGGSTFTPIIDPIGPIADPLPPLPTPQSTPTVHFETKPAKPRNNPSGWVSERDYPASDLRQGNQGRVAFALDVGADGSVSACRVTTSSGFPGLDAATCTLISRRARFMPAVGPEGKKVPGTYSGSIRWVIPD